MIGVLHSKSTYLDFIMAFLYFSTNTYSTIKLTTKNGIKYTFISAILLHCVKQIAIPVITQGRFKIKSISSAPKSTENLLII